MASIEEYKKAVERGNKLLAMMDNSDTAQSSWTSHLQLVQNSWYTERNQTDYDVRGMSSLFGDLAVGLRRGEDHNDTILNNRIKNIALGPGAHYKHTFNVTSGTIFALSLKSPNAAVNTTVSRDLPGLRHWSDVAFLAWQYICESKGSDLQRLQRVVQCSIDNAVTKRIVKEVLGQEPSDYPGHTYTHTGENDKFAALLGTPNASGTGYLVAQHKQQLGGKSVKSIQVFDDLGDLCLVLNLG